MLQHDVLLERAAAPLAKRLCADAALAAQTAERARNAIDEQRTLNKFETEKQRLVAETTAKVEREAAERISSQEARFKALAADGDTSRDKALRELEAARADSEFISKKKMV